MDTTQNNETKKKGLWGFIDRMEGDKVIWVIVLLLMLISILAIFSSTSLIAKESRLDIMREHGFVAIAGLLIVVGLYNIKKIKIFRFFSQFGFILSFVLLLILDCHLNLGFIKAEEINGAYRTLGFLGFQIHVFEIVKVAMVMYLAWAFRAARIDSEDMEAGRESTTFTLANVLAQFKRLSFLKRPFAKRMMYIYFPTLLICGMVAPGSSSSAIFIGIVLMVTIMIGGIPFRELLIPGVALCLVALAAFGIYKISGGESMTRVATFISRMNARYDTARLEPYKEKTVEFYAARDSILQPYGAKLAVHEGKLLGKGSGNSTQKYIVTHIYSDYMFSFLIEEYGLIGGILIIILYISLLARSSMITRLCDGEFGRIAIGGLAFLITGQAFMNMLVSVDLMPMTGQTLPLLSDGASAFLVSCVAFGIILSISRMAKKKMQSVEETVETRKDDIQARLDILEQIDDANL